MPLSGTLFGEVRDLYNSLNFYQQQKYFTKNYIDIDDLAGRLAQEHKFPYEGSADFLTDFAQNVWGQKETRFSFADNPRPTDAEIAEAQRQKDEVKAKWTNPDGTMKKGYHLAPNGKESKLTEDQWLQVRTPNFKKWFGDWENAPENASKVVDENGEPMVVYHGTDWKPLAEKAGEAVFKSSLIKNSSEGFGFYFTKDKTLASGFGEPVACFLNLRNPKYAYDRLSLISTEELEDGDVDVENFDAENAARIRNALGEWKNAMEAKGWDFYNEIDPYLLDGLPKETNTIESILDYVLSADSFLKAEDYNAEDFYNDAREAAADVFGIDGYISENYGNDSGVYVALKPNQIKSATDNAGTFSENPDIRWSIREDSDAEKIDRQHRELYERYKNGEVSADDLQREIDDFMNDFHSERTPERKIIERATPKEKIYNIDEAVDFVRKNLLNKPIHNYVEQEGKIVSATISRNCLDKINSGKSRGKTNNNRLYALAVANIDRLFTLSRRLESELPKNGSPELKAVHRHYAPLLMDGKIYAVKLTVKEFDEKTGNRIYSIEGIDVNGESDLSGLSKKEENPNSSAAIQRSDSVKEFIDEIRNVNKKFHDLARGKISEKAYKEAAKMVADYAESKGYGARVYHGTGADGFNVAKADASEAQNGEGAQAHGMGLYMAENKWVAKKYRENAPKQDFRTIGGRTLKELGITRENFDGVNVEGLVRILASLGVEDVKRTRNERIKKQEERLKSSEKALAKTKSDFGKELAQATIDNAKKQIANDKKALSAIDKIVSILEKNGLSISDYEYRISDGKLFDWFTNLKPENVIDEEKSLSEQPEIWEKLKKIWETVVSPEMEKGLANDDSAAAHVQHYKPTNWIAGEAIVFGWGNFLGKNRFRKIMLKHGIRGITYDGRQDGRCYVSFEGGAAVKLQDPFTFDDNGELIPLSQRFDEKTPDMRFSFATLEKLKNAKPVEVGADDYKGKYELNAKSAYGYVMDTLRKGNPYYIADTDEYVEISQVSAKKITSHDRFNEVYLKTFVAIPDMIKNAIYLGEEFNTKQNGKWDKYRYYACGLKIDGTDYTVRLTIGVKGEKKYYDQSLVKIEKGLLIDNIDKQTSLFDADGNPVNKIDNRLISLLQENKSEKIDFSFADNPIHQKKRELAIKLAKDMYRRLGDGFDPLNPGARREVQPTQEEREGIYMEDLAFLDEDVDDVCNKAEAILWKLVNGTSRKTLQSDFDRMATDAERSFEYSRIVEACVKDALKDFKKELNLSAKIKEQEQRDAQKEADSVTLQPTNWP